MFSDFNFSCLEDSEYKEDSVREDIVAPLLKKIGYFPSGNNRIIRSRPLTHPYVMFGSTKKKINIIPDYLLEVNGELSFVLDAKAPNQNIISGNNVAQVYSYAIHPEVRVNNYGLCNGRQLSLFQVTSTEPKAIYDLTNLSKTDVFEINQKLNPRSIKQSNAMNHILDAGLYMHMILDAQSNEKYYFPQIPLLNLSKLSTDSYTFTAIPENLADRILMMSFDCTQEHVDKLFKSLPENYCIDIKNSLEKQPFSYECKGTPLKVDIECSLSFQPEFSTSGEMFFPLLVKDFKNIQIN